MLVDREFEHEIEILYKYTTTLCCLGWQLYAAGIQLQQTSVFGSIHYANVFLTYKYAWNIYGGVTKFPPSLLKSPLMWCFYQATKYLRGMLIMSGMR